MASFLTAKASKKKFFQNFSGKDLTAEKSCAIILSRNREKLFQFHFQSLSFVLSDESLEHNKFLLFRTARIKSTLALIGKRSGKPGLSATNTAGLRVMRT